MVPREIEDDTYANGGGGGGGGGGGQTRCMERRMDSRAGLIIMCAFLAI